TAITMIDTHAFARWLLETNSKRLSIDWEGYDGADRLAAALPRVVPMLKEEALADANVPYRVWLDAARGGEGELAWLLAKLPEEVYDTLGIWIRWELGDSSASRTRCRTP